MEKISEYNKRNNYGSGFPAMFVYGTLMASGINTIILDNKLSASYKENSQLKSELNETHQTQELNIPFFYQK